MKCPSGFAEVNLVPDSTPVLRRAARLQIVDGLLTVFDEEWTELGVYERHWVDVQSADDGTNETSGAFRVGGSGQFDLVGDQVSTLVGCVHADPNGAPTGQCEKVRNPEVLDVARRVQLLDGLLTFYNAEGTAIGVYHRFRP